MRQKASVKAEDIATAEKDGFFTGRYAMNPFSRERVPIWVGNFVLMEYGTGAIMAVPAHDERDNEFAVNFGLRIPVVVAEEKNRKQRRGEGTGSAVEETPRARKECLCHVYGVWV